MDKIFIKELGDDDYSDESTEFIKKYFSSTWIKEKRFLELDLDPLSFFHYHQLFSYLIKSKQPGLSLKKSQMNRDVNLPQSIVHALHFLTFCCRDRPYAERCQQLVKNITNKKPNNDIITFDQFEIINKMVDLGSNLLITKLTECFKKSNTGKARNNQVNLPSTSMLKYYVYYITVHYVLTQARREFIPVRNKFSQ